jgi:hypothetical protein
VTFNQTINRLPLPAEGAIAFGHIMQWRCNFLKLTHHVDEIEAWVGQPKMFQQAKQSRTDQWAPRTSQVFSDFGLLAHHLPISILKDVLQLHPLTWCGMIVLL